ncbi:transglycosylase SLT domain-containing protein [Methylomonas sp. 11b]|uniref:transglycosylase SLT domain-containing protein n=1 Tax=Methylomonas sp. 11b TaxID=1168169 RepID=UPI00047C69DB|nr:transglycosylase SLT domain-containing protein [Methylomonas sp. 11b]
MALKVPVADVGGTKQAGLPGVRQQGSFTAADFTNQTEMMGLEAASNALQNVQRVSMSLMAKEIDDANRLRVRDAANQLTQFDQDSAFSENGWRNQTGAAVFSQENSKPLTDNVLESRQERINTLMQSLGNDTQRLAFKEHADSTGLQLRGHLMGHEAEQHRVYKRGVLSAGIDSASRNMALYYNDPEQLRTSIDSIAQYSKDLGHLEHGSEEIGIENGKRQISSAISAAIEASLAQSDHASATRILHDFSKDMDSNSMLKAYKLITDEQERRTALDVGQVVIGELYPRMQTGDGDRAFNILLGAESGGRQFDKTGAPITSPKGATGIAQVMPDTGPEAAKLAGVPWDENRFRTDADYNMALGKAYFGKQLTDFKGDLAKAYAAYNSGPAATQAAIMKGGANWLAQLPTETQQYVSKNMNAFAAGQGQYERPTLQDAQQAALDKLGPNRSASLEKETLAVVEKHYNEQTKAIKQREEEATGNAMRQILANGGKWSDLPAQVRGQVPVNDVEKVMNFAKRVNAGEPIETDWGLYYRFKTDERLLMGSNLMAFRDKLGDSEFKQLTEEQQKLGNRSETTLTQLRTPKQIIDQFMVEAGIDPTPKEGDKDGAAKVGKIWSTFENRVKAAEQDKGKKLDSEEMRKVAAQLFTSVKVKGLLFSSEKPAALVDLKEVKVPDAERKAIIDAWRQARPDRQITEQDIFTMYARNKGLM